MLKPYREGLLLDVLAVPVGHVDAPRDLISAAWSAPGRVL